MKEVTTNVVLTVGFRAPDSNTRAIEAVICVKTTLLNLQIHGYMAEKSFR